MEEALTAARDPDALERVDADALRDLAGDDAIDDLDQLRELTRALEEAGYLDRDGRAAGAHAAGRPQARDASVDRYLQPPAPRGLRGPCPAASRSRRRADRRDEALRVRRSVRGRHQPHPVQRHGARRAGESHSAKSASRSAGATGGAASRPARRVPTPSRASAQSWSRVSKAVIRASWACRCTKPRRFSMPRACAAGSIRDPQERVLRRPCPSMTWLTGDSA